MRTSKSNDEQKEEKLEDTEVKNFEVKYHENFKIMTVTGQCAYSTRISIGTKNNIMHPSHAS